MKALKRLLARLAGPLARDDRAGGRTRGKKPAGVRRRAEIEACEERILYSADLNPLQWGGVSPSAEVRLADPEIVAAPAGQSRRELVFIDSAVDDGQQFIDGLQSDDTIEREVFVLSGDAGGLDQISAVLAARTAPIDAVHIVSHGGSGHLLLGDDQVDLESLDRHAAALAQWQQVLGDEADLLLYGCDVGAGEAGSAFLAALAAHTGADVAASQDATGHASLGGNWTLESRVGEVTTGMALSADFRSDWQGLLLTYTVRNTNDSGTDSLRAAIEAANSTPAADVIDFAIPGPGVHTINLLSALPVISREVSIDATTDDSFTQNGSRPAIILDGQDLNANGLVLGDEADGSSIRGLVIRNFGQHGILVSGGNVNATIIGNYIGQLTETGAAAATGLGNGASGVAVQGFNTRIGSIDPSHRNVIAGNGVDGIYVNGSGAGLVIQGNYIGTTATGTVALPNQGHGILMHNGTTAATIGGTAAGAGNLVSGNGGIGIVALYDGVVATSNITIQGNRVGVDSSGTAALPNAGHGVAVLGATNVRVGGSAAGAGNVISGNLNSGVVVEGSSTGVTIRGNYIGLDQTGSVVLGNQESGIQLQGGSGTVIGGAQPGQGNIISGNTYNGVRLGPGSVSTVVQGNRIGTDASGTLDRGNRVDGIQIDESPDNTIRDNQISGNDVFGIYLVGEDSDRTTIVGNRIGTNATGTAALGNTRDGISISAGPDETRIGGTVLADRNLISGNDEDGIEIAGLGTTDLQVLGNDIGTNAAGTAALANRRFGLVVYDGASNIRVGGADPNAANVISGNALNGIQLDGNNRPETRDIFLQGNFIGVNRGGTAAIANGNWGLLVIAGLNNSTIGGSNAGEGNIISGNVSGAITFISAGTTANRIEGNTLGLDASGTTTIANGWHGIQMQSPGNTIRNNLVSGNGGNGILIDGEAADNNVIVGNRIGTDGAGTVARGNTGYGIEIRGGADGTVIGGTTAQARNLLSGNWMDGILVSGTGTTGTVIHGNYIGVTAAGTAALGNLRHGVTLYDGVSNTLIGGTAANAGNLISGNEGIGLVFSLAGASGQPDNVVEGNRVGLDVSGTVAIGNQNQGVYIGSSTGVRVGGPGAAARNLISGNGSNGILVTSDNTVGARIENNYIGTDVTGTLARPNGSNGVMLEGPANQVVDNLIAANTESGVRINNTAASGNVLAGNLIGTVADGTAALANQQYGVAIYSAAATTIGGTTAAERNVISGNRFDGIFASGSATTGTMIQGNYIGTTSAGTAALGNGRNGIHLNDGPTVTRIGTSGVGNVIAANAEDGIRLDGMGTTMSGNFIRGNLIGLDRTGAVALGNVGSGISLRGGAAATTIGGTTAGERNVISANAVFGIEITGAQSVNQTVSGNYIGTDSTGNAARGNGAAGVRIINAGSSTIGGSAAGSGNVISGNGGDGILISGSTATANLIAGNRIGVSAAGAALGNQGFGIRVTDGADDTRIGLSTNASSGNLIGANGQDGIRVDGTGTDRVRVHNNHIGMSSTGTVLANHDDGIEINGSGSGHQIGGIAANQRNVIAANSGVGIALRGTGANATTVINNVIGFDAANNLAQGNHKGILLESHHNALYGNVIVDSTEAGVEILGNGNILLSNAIGTNLVGTLVMANGGAGILIAGSASSNRIGGTGDDEGNRIFHNLGGGIAVTGTARDNAFLGNLLRQNTGLGIDLGPTGVTPNDPGDVDTGANDLQNHPVIIGATDTPSLDLRIVGYLDSTANATFRLEFFLASGTAVDPSGSGEASAFLASINVTTDAAGRASFDFLAPGGGLSGSSRLVATATRDLGMTSFGSTSEFSGNVAQNQAPVITSNGGGASAAISIQEGLTTVTTVTATDPEVPLQTLSYSISGGADAARFTINAATGALSFSAAPYRHAPADGNTDNVYEVTVRVADNGGASDTQALQVTVTAGSPIGALGDSDSAANAVVENAANGLTVGLTALAVDPDPQDAIVYSLDNNAGGRFAIHATTGVVTVADGSRLDREASDSYGVVVRATSADGTFSTQQFWIDLIDVNEFPVGAISDIDAAADEVAENAVNGTAVGIRARAVDPDKTTNAITYTLDDNAGGRFGVHATTGVVTVADSIQLNREAAASHGIVVRATSADGSQTTQAFTIAVLDVNEFPVGAISDGNAAADQVVENAANGTTVGITAVAVDPDATTNTITYALDNNAGGRFAIDATTGIVTVADGSLLNREAAASHGITVRATSADGSHTTQAFTISLLDVNEFPVGAISDSNAADDQVAENAANGTAVGITAVAVDPDATTNTITYSLDNNAGGRFAIHATTGVVTVADGSQLNREAAASHGITVRATSADGSHTTQAFTISLLDVNEFPVGAISDSNVADDEVAENAANGTAVGITAVAVDPDATTNTITYSLDNNAGGRFAIHATTGIVTVADGSLLNREAAGSHGIVVRATSADGSFTTQAFAISLLDVNEFPIGAISDSNAADDEVAENAANGTMVGITAVAVDPDATTNAIGYSLDNNAGGRFAIGATTGVVTVADGTLLNREAAASHGIVVRATSADGSTRTRAFTIALLDVNEFPVGAISDGNAADDQVAENAVNGTTVGVTAAAVDADATTNSITYTLDNSAGGRFAIHATTGVVTVADGSLLNREVAASHGIVVRAASADGSSTTQAFTIALLDVNEFPVGSITDGNAVADEVAENAVNGTTVGIAAVAVDPDATTNAISYSLDNNAGGRFAIDATTGVVTVADGSLLNREAAASHGITVRATSADGSHTTQVFTISLLDVNEFPVGTISDSNATADQVVENAANGTTVGITAIAVDPDATTNAVTYTLDIDAGGRFAIHATTGIVTVADGSLLNREAAVSHGITVRATSADGSHTTQAFTISLLDVNEFPVGAISDSNAADDEVAENAANGTVAGITAVAVDPDATTNTITYTLDNDAGGRFAIHATTGVVTVADGALLNREAAASHGITVRAMSADGSMTTRAVTIALIDVNEFPVGAISDSNATDDQVSENAANGTTVGITAIAVDPDATTNAVTYSLDNNAGGRFAIDSATGVVSVADGTLLNLEAAANHGIVVRATSADGSHTTRAFTISLLDVNEFPVGAISDGNVADDQVAENAANGTTVGITAIAVDPDATTNAVTYTLDIDAGGRFAIHATTGIVTVADGSLLDREAAASHGIVVRATSADGSTTTEAFSIAVLDVNEFPVGAISDGNVADDQVAENAVNGTTVGITAVAVDPDATTNTVTYSLDNNAGGRFEIDATTGVVTVADGTLLNREAAASHGIVVRATSADGSTRTQAFTIALLDVNEFPVGSISDSNAAADEVAENAANGTTVGITAVAVDPDATTNATSYSLDNNAGGRFAIDATTGVVTVADGTLLNREAAASHGITVRATSADGSTRSQAFTIALLDVNEFPVGSISDGNAAADEVAENAANGTTVGITAVAVDPDATTNAISYSLDNNAGGRFAIDATTGVVTVADGTLLNREAAASHGITVRATSADGSHTTRAFTISLLDVNEFPVGVISDSNAADDQVAENAANGTAVGITAVAVDPDATTNAVTYTLDNNAGGRFAIGATTGVVTVADASLLNREVAASHGIVVRATSADGSFSTQAFAIALLDVNEFPVGAVSDSSIAADEVAENAANGTAVGVTAVAVDPDATTNSITYSLDSSAGGRFAIHATNGVVTVADASLLNREVAASHGIVVRATSADGSHTTLAFTIALLDINEFPVGSISDGSAAADEVAENAANGTTVGITAVAVDPDATTNAISYSLDNNAGGRFAIHATTGVVTVADGTLLNREVAASHGIVVRATSADGSTTTGAFSIAVLDVNEFPVGAISDSNAADDEVAENAANGTAVGITAVAVDPDATTNAIGYSLDNNAGGRFAINATTGIVTVADGSLLNREAAASHGIVVRATSADGSHTTRAFTISLLDVNEFPVGAISDSNAADDQVAENAVNGTTVGITAVAVDPDATTNTVSYSLDNNAGGRFEIDATTGVVTVADGTLLNREAAASHGIVVRATSADGSTRTQAFTIALLDVNEFPVGSISDGSAAADEVAENAANGTTVGITAVAVDPDATTNAISYSLDNNAGGRFAIDATTGVVTVADGTLLNREAASSHGIVVRATSADGSTTTGAFTIDLADVNEFPVGAIGDSNAADDQVVENAANGTTVGITAVAADPDATTNTISYSLENDAGGRFAIDTASGVVTVADGSLLDREAAASHGITVRATSADGSFSIRAFTIGLIDVNEHPVGAISDSDSAPDEVIEQPGYLSTVGITAVAVDPDATNNTITYTLDDDDGGRFVIDPATGVVRVETPVLLDRETAASHAITVRATSSDGSFRTAVFTIDLLDRNESPVGLIHDVDDADDRVVENAASGTTVGLTAFAVDPDVTTNAITYSLDYDAEGRFAIDATTGVVTVANGALLDREAAMGHSMLIRATSADGSHSVMVFSITLVDVNEFPVGAVSDDDPAADEVAENAANGTTVGITAVAADPDATTSTITYSLDDTAGGRFAIHATSGVVTVADGSLLNRELAASHGISVRATSADGSFSIEDFTIALLDVNEYPVGAVSDSDATSNEVAENAATGTVVGITALAVDPDATTNTISYSLDDSAGGRFAIDAATGVVTVADGSLIDRESVASHGIMVRATSADGSFRTETFTIAVLDVNEYPVGAVSDSDTAVNEVAENVASGTVVGITALAVDSDATTNAIAYSLDTDAGGRFAIDAASGVVTVADGSLIDREAAASHGIVVRATSADGSSRTESFSIAVLDVNEYPVGAVGDNDAATNEVAENAANGAVVGVTALASDLDATTNTVTYTLDDSADGRFAIDAATGVVTVADGSLLDRETAASHGIVVRATSADGSHRTEAFTMAVLDVNEHPVGVLSDSNATTNAVAENAAVGTAVGITAVAVDPDATTNTISYALDDSAGGRFSIDAISGVVTVADSSLLDREAASDHTITVRATSADGSFSTGTFTIALIDVNEHPVGPVTDGNGAVNEVAENAVAGTVVGITAGAIDPDATTNSVTYALDDAAGGRFAIDAATGVVTVADGNLLDREAAASHGIEVRATSADGSFRTEIFTIAVLDVNEYPVGGIVDSDPAVDEVAENAADGAVVGVTALASDPDATTNAVSYSLDDSADGRFAIDASTGVVTVADGSRLDREAAASHGIVVRATSADGSFSIETFTIALIDVNEHAVGSLTDGDAAVNDVAENATTGTVVGITALAVDPDATTNTISYALDDSAGGRFAIDATSGVVTVADSSLLDREAASGHAITVRATSADGSFRTESFLIAVMDVDEYPVGVVIDSDAAINEVAENAATGTVVGVTAVAVDPDATRNTITYSLDNNAGGRFAIDAATGVVTVADGSLLDRETAASHGIVVRATSADGSHRTESFTIAVLDVNEYPVGAVSDSDAVTNEVAENAATGTVVGITALAVDPDATTNTILYSLDDSSGGRFVIDAGTGVVTVADGSLIDREAAASHGIVVRVTSADGSFRTESFMITVLDVDENPVGAVSDSNAAINDVAENAATGTVVGITALAVDPDATTNTVAYSLDADAGGRFAIDAATGVVTVSDGSLIDREVAASHGIVVRATSADGSSRTESFTISVLDVNEYPVGAVGDNDAATNEVAENAANGAVVGFTALASDPDATTNAVSYSLDDSADGRFAIDASTGVVTVADGSRLDREAAASHGIVVRATSADGSFRTGTFTIALIDVNEHPVGAVSDDDVDINEVAENAATGTVVGITALAVDPDATTNTITYTLDDSASGRFAIDAATGVVTVADSNLLDREMAASHGIVVRATSADGSFRTETFTIAVLDVNEYPVGPITDGDPAATAVAENAATGTTVGLTALAVDADATTHTLVYSLDDDAGGRFAIDPSTGIVTVADGSLLDRELAASHGIVVRAMSADGSFTTATFTIAVVDVNEYPVGAVSDGDVAVNQVAENAATGTAVGIMALAVDPDATTNAITYTLDDSAGGRFAIDAATGIVTVADGSLLDREAAASHGIMVRATSADGSTATGTFTIAVHDVDETPVGPIADRDGRSDEVGENSGKGTTVGLSALAFDADATTSTITYSLDDDAGGRFAIDPATGVVVVADRSRIDREAAASLDVTIRATSDDGSFATRTFTIAVLDVNEFTIGPISDSDGALDQLAYGAVNGQPVGVTAQAVDADATVNTVTYSLDDSAEGRFSIDARTGVITVADLSRVFASRVAGYDVIVRASSSDGSATTASFRIGVVMAPAEPPTPAPAPAPPPARPESPTVAPTGVAPEAAPAPVAPAPPEAAAERPWTGSGTPVPVPGGLIELGWEADRTINPAAHASAQPEPRRFLPSAAVSGISIPGTGWQPSVQAALVVQPGVIGGSLERESSEPERISALALEDGTVRRDGLRAPDNVVSVTIDTTALSTLLLSAGGVWWLTHGGGLVTMMLMGVPAWRHMDLLPIVSRFDDDDIGDDLLDDEVGEAADDDDPDDDGLSGDDAAALPERPRPEQDLNTGAVSSR